MSDNSETKSAEDYKQELQKQIDKIDKAIAALPEGEISNLQELDRDVSDLCNRLENAPRNIAQESEALMSRMISRLEELEQKLRAHQDELNLGGDTESGQAQDDKPASGTDASESDTDPSGESGENDGNS